jgi:hypothetical protein
VLSRFFIDQFKSPVGALYKLNIINLGASDSSVQLLGRFYKCVALKGDHLEGK